MRSEILEHPLNPIIYKDTEVLILGSFPSIKSFENDSIYRNILYDCWQQCLSDYSNMFFFSDQDSSS